MSAFFAEPCLLLNDFFLALGKQIEIAPLGSIFLWGETEL